MTENQEVLQRTIERCRERNIIIPTYKQMRNPELIPEGIKNELKNVGLWDFNPRNLFRITWKNEPKTFGGCFGKVNHVVLPSSLTGVKAKIVLLVGKYFPTGAHKVGASFGPLVEKLITGNFDPTRQKAVWPSTGNYCRGGAFNSRLLGCDAIAILPERMSSERFEWLKNAGAEIIATYGCESNVKEIYDEVRKLETTRKDSVVTLNQFAEMGNPIWHYWVTAPAMEEIFNSLKTSKSRFTGLFLTQGSGGVLGSSMYLREKFPLLKVAAGEALQCPTLLYNGYGDHRIEGIGDKHVPWVLNMKNIDMVIGLDDEVNIKIMRLFNEKEGQKVLVEAGVPSEVIENLSLMGISSIANMMGAIKMAKYYEMTEDDVVFAVATDSMEMYQSRIQEERILHGEYTFRNAVVDYDGHLQGINVDNMVEMSYYEKKQRHNLKYFTWVEQQGKTVEELNEQWYNDNYWKDIFAQVENWDAKIAEFNEKTGLLKKI